MNGRGYAERYRRIWRWHFFAGLFCIPFMLWLACTGTIYLFKPQIEAYLDRPFGAVAVAGRPFAAPAEIVRAAVAANPGSRFRSYQLPMTTGAAVQILTVRNDAVQRVYVNPQTSAILKNEAEDARPMRRIFHLHGELLLGDRGSNLVELAASWGIVLLVSGLFLHWPRDARSLAGVLYPRRLHGRAAWKEWHAVTGVWISLFTLFFLVSGLPWTAGWGGLLQTVRSLNMTALSGGTASAGAGNEHTAHNMRSRASGGAAFDWTAGSEDERRRIRAAASDSAGYAAITQVVAAAQTLHLAAPVYIDAPTRNAENMARVPAGGAQWTIRSDTQNRPERVNVTADDSGHIVTRRGFADLPAVDKAVAIGVAAHEGQLFGAGNQLLALFTTGGLCAVSLSGLRMWWMRRLRGTLSAPRAAPASAHPMSFYVLVALLAVLLPFMGISLFAVLLIECSRELSRRMRSATVLHR